MACKAGADSRALTAALVFSSKGSIEPGKLADLVVLGRDPFKEHPSTLVTIPVERTMVGGKWVLRIMIFRTRMRKR